VHCGFCLPACPTYVSWGLEADSPRGRIDLMKGIEEGTVALDATTIGHFDACLGCMGCVTACPSGVRYDLLIESTRAQVEAAAPRSPGERLLRSALFALFPYPRRLAWLARPIALMQQLGLQALLRRSGLVKLLPQPLRALERIAPTLVPTDLAQPLPPFTAAVGTKRGSVALLTGCVQRAFFPNVNAATVRVLAAEGFDVLVFADQGCCGALSLHVGLHDEAVRFAGDLVRRCGDLATVDAVIVNAAGCGSTLKQYAELMPSDAAAAAFEAKVRDVSEFLAEVGLVAPRRPMPLRVAYHDACHLAHAQRIRAQPRELLRAIPGLELLEIPQGEQCCGSAGVYNVLEPGSAGEIGARKAANVASVMPDLLASANPGCTLQIAAALADLGMSVATAHPIELLDASLA